MPAGRCSGNLFLGIAKGLGATRRTPGASCPSANLWGRDGRSGVTPKRAPIPTGNERAYGRPLRFGQGMGWLARKLSSRVPPGPRAMVWLALGSIRGWRLPALRLCRETLRRVDIQHLFAGRTVSVTPWRIGEAWPV